ncbi:MAG: redoxin domain-containing protein [Elusimicrobia bacterium]|nr:redoxin domain-containing protein [Elusimicrobiota bacterium]
MNELKPRCWATSLAAALVLAAAAHPAAAQDAVRDKIISITSSFLGRNIQEAEVPPALPPAEGVACPMNQAGPKGGEIESLSWPGNMAGEAPDSAAAPDFSLKDLNGRTVSLHQFRGKVVLLTFFNRACGPCMDEIPTLIQIQNRYGRRGLVVLNVNTALHGTDSEEKERQSMRIFAREAGINFPILFDLDGKVMNDRYRTNTLGHSFLIGPDGNFYSKYFYAFVRFFKDICEQKQKGLYGLGAMVANASGPLGVEVVRVYPGSGAHAAGMNSGDIIAELDGKSTVGWSGDKLRNAIMGPPGTEVQLRVWRGGRSQPVPVRALRNWVLLDQFLKLLPVPE